MNSSLRDQLLAAGLVTEKQAKQAAQQEQQRHFRERARQNPHQNPNQRDGQRGGQHGKHGGPRQGGPHPGSKGGGQRPDAARPQNNTPAPVTPAAVVPTAAPATLLAHQAQAAKVARDMELNRRREEKAQRRARLAQIEQLIEQNRVPRLETEDYYSFIDGKKIRRMAVDPERRERLTSGSLVIVRYQGHYAVVPKDTAERIRERDPNMIVPVVTPKQTAPAATDDDAYKDFVVPDDLMW